MKVYKTNIRHGYGGMLLKEMFKIKSGMDLGACSSRQCLRLNLAWIWGHAPQGNV